jgi:hypothetical protein
MTDRRVAAVASVFALIVAALVLVLSRHPNDGASDAHGLPLSPVSVDSSVWKRDLRDGGEVQFVRRSDFERDASAEASVPRLYHGPKLRTLGPLDEVSLKECKSRLNSVLRHAEKQRADFIAGAIPEEKEPQDDWCEQALRLHYKCLKLELATNALEAGDYWVFEPGARSYPADIVVVDIYGVNGLGRANLTVVVPLSLQEHPELARQGADLEDYVRYRSRLFADAFNARSHEDRAAAIGRNDDMGRRLGELNAAMTRDGLTDADAERLAAEMSEVLMWKFPMYCVVDRERHMLYVSAGRR